MKKKHFLQKKNPKDENILIKKKRHRKADVIWTLEEEYIFFEIHKIFGNQWKKFSIFFPYKTTKELKNHFHTCIIKTVRRAINYNLNYEFIDILRCFYSIDEIFLIFNQMNFESKEKDIKKNCNFEKKNNLLSLNQETLNNTLKKKKRDNKYNPRLLRKKGILTDIILLNYKNYLFNEILMKRPDIKKFLEIYNNQKLNIEQVHWLFEIIIKSKIINKCKKLILEMNNNNNFKMNIINILLKYINENPLYMYLDDLYFSNC